LELRFKLIFSTIAEVLRGWRQAALAGVSPRLADDMDDMVECHTGEHAPSSGAVTTGAVPPPVGLAEGTAF
jgi:hypothetical protein